MSGGVHSSKNDVYLACIFQKDLAMSSDVDALRMTDRIKEFTYIFAYFGQISLLQKPPTF